MTLDILVISVTMLVCVVLMFFQIYRNRKEAALISFSTCRLPICLLAIVFGCASGIAAWSQMMYITALILLVGIFPLWLLSSTFLIKSPSVIIICWIVQLAVCCAIVIGISICRISVPIYSYGILYMLTASCFILYFIISLWIYLKAVRNVVGKTTAWTALTLSVDVVYLLFLVADVFALCGSCFCSGNACRLIVLLPTLSLLLMVVALTSRISTDSLLCIMKKHENLILSAMNDSSGLSPANNKSQDDMYKEIYDRIVTYFESDEPYLNGDFVLEDLVRAVYANKLYVSRAISKSAGRNFCQFVNYYRVRHSVEVFKKNPELKVAELACQSGFNSVVSFTMAFKLFMHENPSDWIRNERNRMSKSRPIHPI